MRSSKVGKKGRIPKSHCERNESRETDERPKTRKEQARGVGVHGDGAKGMNKHALWADLEEVVEVKEAALVGAISIKPELRRYTDLFFFLYEHIVTRDNDIKSQMIKIIKTIDRFL